MTTFDADFTVFNHNSNPPPPEGRFKRFIYTSHKIVECEGIRAAVECSHAIIEAVSLIFEQLGEQYVNARHRLEEGSALLGHAFEVLGISALFGYVKWWICDTAKSTYELASKIFLTAFRTLRTVSWLERCGAYSLASITVNIGRVPLISILTWPFLMIGAGLGAVQLYKEYQTQSTRLAQVADPLQGSHINRTLKTLKLDMGVCVLDAMSGLLILISLSTGLGVIALTGPLMISIGVATTSFGLFTLYYNQRTADILKEKPSKNIRIQAPRQDDEEEGSNDGRLAAFVSGRAADTSSTAARTRRDISKRPRTKKKINVNLTSASNSQFESEVRRPEEPPAESVGFDLRPTHHEKDYEDVIIEEESVVTTPAFHPDPQLEDKLAQLQAGDDFEPVHGTLAAGDSHVQTDPAAGTGLPKPHIGGAGVSSRRPKPDIFIE